MTASIFGLSTSGQERAMAAYATALITPPPKPCKARAAISIGIDVAIPPMTSPATNSAIPTMNGVVGP